MGYILQLLEIEKKKIIVFRGSLQAAVTNLLTLL